MFRGYPDPITGFAVTQGHHTAVHDFRHGRAWTYAELNGLIDTQASRLRQVISPGDRVVVIARNSVELIVLMYATIRAGGVFVPLNWRLSAAEIAALLEDCRPAVVYCQPEFAASLELVKGGGLKIALDGEVLEATGAPGADARRALDQTAIILYTSGTTGRPKGVCISLANTVATARNFAAVTDVTKRSRSLCDSPMFHVMGLLAVTRTALWTGSVLYVSAGFNATDTLARLADPAFGITHYCCVPQMAKMLREVEGFRPEALRRLRALFVGGAPLTQAAAQPWLDDGIDIINGYGMTEAGTVIHMPLDNPRALASHASSIGLPAPFIRVRLRDRNGREPRPGEVGEIWVKGPSVASGYWNQADATQAAFKGRWYCTGDAARRDAQGFYHLVDRWKDMYISGGENVFPAEVELALMTLPGVREAAVVGCEDAKWGEIGVAFIAADPQAGLTADTVVAHCRAHLAAFKAPRRVIFVDTLPRTATGKVRKDELRHLAKEIVPA